MLAKHPNVRSSVCRRKRSLQIQQTLYDEIVATFGTRDIDYERVMKLPYLVSRFGTQNIFRFEHAVFLETLRLYPPVLTLTARCCTKVSFLFAGRRNRALSGYGNWREVAHSRGSQCRHTSACHSLERAKLREAS